MLRFRGRFAGLSHQVRLLRLVIRLPHRSPSGEGYYACGQGLAGTWPAGGADGATTAGWRLSYGRPPGATRRRGGRPSAPARRPCAVGSGSVHRLRVVALYLQPGDP